MNLSFYTCIGEPHFRETQQHFQPTTLSRHADQTLTHLLCPLHVRADNSLDDAWKARFINDLFASDLDTQRIRTVLVPDSRRDQFKALL